MFSSRVSTGKSSNPSAPPNQGHRDIQSTPAGPQGQSIPFVVSTGKSSNPRARPNRGHRGIQSTPAGPQGQSIPFVVSTGKSSNPFAPPNQGHRDIQSTPAGPQGQSIPFVVSTGKSSNPFAPPNQGHRGIQSTPAGPQGHSIPLTLYGCYARSYQADQFGLSNQVNQVAHASASAQDTGRDKGKGKGNGKCKGEDKGKSERIAFVPSDETAHVYAAGVVAAAVHTPGKQSHLFAPVAWTEQIYSAKIKFEFDITQFIGMMKMRLPVWIIYAFAYFLHAVKRIKHDNSWIIYGCAYFEYTFKHIEHDNSVRTDEERQSVLTRYWKFFQASEHFVDNIFRRFCNYQKAAFPTEIPHIAAMNTLTATQLHEATGESKEACQMFLTHLNIQNSNYTINPGPIKYCVIRAAHQTGEEWEKAMWDVGQKAARMTNPNRIYVPEWYVRMMNPEDFDRKATKRNKRKDRDNEDNEDNERDVKRQRIRLPPLASLMTGLSLSDASKMPGASE
jgi:hypothetical protein